MSLEYAGDFITARNELRQGNVFTSVYQEFCPQWGVHGRGWGVHGRGGMCDQGGA